MFSRSIIEGPGDQPETIGSYRFVRKLGEEGMGIVYEALAKDPGDRYMSTAEMSSALEYSQSQMVTSEETPISSLARACPRDRSMRRSRSVSPKSRKIGPERWRR